MSNAGISSGLRRGDTVGRKPSKNPLSTLISFRIDAAATRALDTELEKLLTDNPGLMLGRGDMVRILMTEALAARAKKRSK